MQTKYILRYETGDTEEFATLDALAKYVASESECFDRTPDEEFHPHKLDQYIADNGLSAFDVSIQCLPLRKIVADYVENAICALHEADLYPEEPYRLLCSELVLTGRV